MGSEPAPAEILVRLTVLIGTFTHKCIILAINSFDVGLQTPRTLRTMSLFPIDLRRTRYSSYLAIMR